MSIQQPTISSPMHKKIVALFNFLDKDSNGEISWSEFVSFQLKSREVLKDTWPLDINTLRGEFTDLDLNGDGKIVKNEFVDVLLRYFQQGTPATIAQVGNMIDLVVNSNNYEFNQIDTAKNDLQSQGEEEFIQKMLSVFDEADLDGDGSIDFSEFIKNEWQNEDQSQHLSTVTSTSKATTVIAYKSLQQLRREFSNRDLNKDGKISREEFKIISQRCYRANLQN